jgi:DNA-binding NtrC family response regulator
MERAVLLAGQGPIESRHFLLDPDSYEIPEEYMDAGDCGRAQTCAGGGLAGSAGGEAPGFEAEVMPLEEMERRMILKSLDKTQGNRTQAAELLGLSVRTLRNKLAEYRKLGMEIP